MNHTQILRRAWNILWSYKALWIFGIILALTAGSGSRGNNFNYNLNDNGNGQYNFDLPGLEQFNRELDRLGDSFSGPQFEQVVIPVIIAIVCVSLLLGVFFLIARLVSLVAQVRMVDQYETTGEKVSWRQGVRLGWSKAAWRLFLINLLVIVPTILAVIALLGCAALPILLGMLGGQDPSTPSIVATIGLGFLVIFAIIVLSVVLSIVLEFVYRVCLLENQGVIASIREGWALVRRNLKSVGLMWLILFGIRLALTIVLIPVGLLLFGIAVLIVLAIGAGIYFAVQAAVSITAGWIAAALIGIALFILILGLPLLFIGGLRETYFSSTWTLAYREIRPMLPAVEEVEVSPA